MNSSDSPAECASGENAKESQTLSQGMIVLDSLQKLAAAARKSRI